MPEADEAILLIKCDCAARRSLTTIKRVSDNSTPEGLLRRAGLHDFGLPRVFPVHRRLPPRPGNLDNPTTKPCCCCGTTRWARPLATPHLPLAPSVGSPFGAAPAYIKTADASRASGKMRL